MPVAKPTIVLYLVTSVPAVRAALGEHRNEGNTFRQAGALHLCRSPFFAHLCVSAMRP
jgi:hypothetical protein